MVVPSLVKSMLTHCPLHAPSLRKSIGEFALFVSAYPYIMCLPQQVICMCVTLCCSHDQWWCWSTPQLCTSKAREWPVKRLPHCMFHCVRADGPLLSPTLTSLMGQRLLEPDCMVSAQVAIKICYQMIKVFLAVPWPCWVNVIQVTLIFIWHINRENMCLLCFPSALFTIDFFVCDRQRTQWAEIRHFLGAEPLPVLHLPHLSI